jgi:hypothetical protein
VNNLRVDYREKQQQEGNQQACAGKKCGQWNHKSMGILHNACPGGCHKKSKPWLIESELAGFRSRQVNYRMTFGGDYQDCAPDVIIMECADFVTPQGHYFTVSAPR